MRVARAGLRHLVAAAALAATGLSAAQTAPVLSGTFVQLNAQLAALGPAGWAAELTLMQAIGFNTVIVQYSRYGDTTYFPSTAQVGGPPPAAAALPPDESVARLAWTAPAGASARYLRLTVTPASREWTMIPELRVLSGGSNVAAGLGYELTPAPAGTYLDPDAGHGGKLTDGLANFAWADMVGWQNPGEQIVITLDLGAPTPLEGVELDFMRSDVSGVELPAGFAVEVSADGQHFLGLGTPAGWSDDEATRASSTRDPIGELLGAAEELGFEVWLGLSLDPTYWQGAFDAAASAAANTDLMLRLEELYGASPALVGYYLPEEIDDRSFVSQTAHAAMTSYLSAMVDAAHDQVGRPVMVAPYFGMNPDAAAYAAWWDATLATAKLDVIAMQDGVGTKRTTAMQGAPMYEALKAVADRHGVALWSDLEVFEQTHGWPVDDLGWQATSANMTTVRQQLELEAPYVSKFVVFDFTNHMSPRLGGPAARLYADYQAYLAEREP